MRAYLSLLEILSLLVLVDRLAAVGRVDWVRVRIVARTLGVVTARVTTADSVAWLTISTVGWVVSTVVVVTAVGWVVATVVDVWRTSSGGEPTVANGSVLLGNVVRVGERSGRNGNGREEDGDSGHGNVLGGERHSGRGGVSEWMDRSKGRSD
jgi:hypothetical protein